MPITSGRRAALLLAIAACALGSCDPTEWDPCQGKSCGDGCSPCQAGPSCSGLTGVYACDRHGACISGAPSCGPARP